MPKLAYLYEKQVNLPKIINATNNTNETRAF